MTVIVVSFFESVVRDHSKDHAVAVACFNDTLTGEPYTTLLDSTASGSGSVISERDPAPTSEQLYEELARLWIYAPHQLPGTGRRPARTITLGEMELVSLTDATIRDWSAAAVHTTDRRAASASRRPGHQVERRACEQWHAARSSLDDSIDRSWAVSDHEYKLAASVPSHIKAAAVEALGDRGLAVHTGTSVHDG